MAVRELRVVLTVSDLERAVQFFRDELGLGQIAASLFTPAEA